MCDGEKLDSDPTLDFAQKIIRALEAMHARGHLDNKTMEYLTPEDPKPGRFYIYIYIYKRLEASDNHTIYLSHWIAKLLRTLGSGCGLVV
jgi:triphosphoribosyl-dephospho-CoA synthetase